MALMIPAFCKRTKQDRTVEEASRPSSVPSSPWTRRRAMPRWPAHARTARHDAERHSRLAMWCHAGVGIRLPGWGLSVLALQVRKLVLGEDHKGALPAPPLVREAKLKSLKGCGLQERNRSALSPSPLTVAPTRPPAGCVPSTRLSIHTQWARAGRPWGRAAPRCPTAAALCLSGGLSVAVAVAVALCVCGVRMRAHE